MPLGLPSSFIPSPFGERVRVRGKRFLGRPGRTTIRKSGDRPVYHGDHMPFRARREVVFLCLDKIIGHRGHRDGCLIKLIIMKRRNY